MEGCNLHQLNFLDLT